MRDVVLIVPAAGSGQRFGSATPKQYLRLAGRSVLCRGLDAFAGIVTRAVLAVADDQRGRVEELLAKERPLLPTTLASGGATRQDSVHRALETCAAAGIALVHDAVRPLVPRACIAACVAALDRHAAAVVAIPCAATVKRAAADGETVDATVPRDGLWLAQTPQGFDLAIGRAAFARAAAEGWACSDDAQVLERAGHRVALVRGDARNLKITTPDDLALAEALLAMGSGLG